MGKSGIRGVRKIAMMAEAIVRHTKYGDEITTYQAIDLHKKTFRNFTPDTRSAPFLLRKLGFRLVAKGTWKPTISEEELIRRRNFYNDKANGKKRRTTDGES